MKKFYLSILLFLAGLSAFAQTTRYVYAFGGVGSYRTGSATLIAITEDVMIATPSARRSFAVFNVTSVLPAGASITSVKTGFFIAGISGTGSGGNKLNGYLGDISTITDPLTMYNTMGSSTTYNTTSWNTFIGDDILPSNTPTVTFVQNAFNASSKVSMIWDADVTPGPGLSYNIDGQSGSPTTTGSHAPYLEIQYDCTGLTITADATPSTLCANAPFTLTSSSTTGVTYHWYGPGGFASTLQNPGTMPGLTSSGVYTLVVTNAAGCDATRFVPVTLNPSPNTTISVSSPAFCPGDNAVLTVPAVTGNTYQWYNAGVAIPGATDDTYTTATSATLKVEVTDADGCSATTPVATNVALIEQPSVTPGGNLALCYGDNGLVTVSTNGVTSGITFQWTKDGAAIAGATNSTYVITATGAYACALDIAASGCHVVSDTVNAVVSSYPTPPVTNSGTMLSTTPGYTTYQWYLNTTAVSGATNATFIPAANGNYRVRVTNTNGCVAFSSSVLFSTVGVAQLNNEGISISPNPANAMLHIESPEQVKAVITGLEGKVLMVQADAKDMNISPLADGLYIITLYSASGERVAVQQIIKQ